MVRENVQNEYLNWLIDTVSSKYINSYSRSTSYRYLLSHLHDIEFTYTILRDQDRAEEGEYLRYRFAMAQDYDDVDWVLDILDGSCSVLEMMVALAIHCEESIMDNPTVGDRTGQWFWGMIVNLGLGDMCDARYDKHIVETAICRFLNRDYEPDGTGGLFRIRNCEYDLRTVDIWHQLCWYSNTIN